MIRQLRALLASLFFLSLCSLGFAQSAQIQGQVSDSSGAVLPKALVRVVNQLTGTERKVATNGSGQYSVPGLDPSVYKIFAQAFGFSTAVSTPLTLNVGQNAVLDFKMQVGQQAQTVTVDASGLQINTTDASVSTVVDRKFVENMPLNGRSFQSLLSLAPGVALVPSSNGVGYGGEVSVNGQRTESNYFMVDGVSANTGASPIQGIAGAGLGGGTSQETVLGTTQSMVSIDALEEFKASTSTYSAEYGRTPGGQFSFSTRAGTNSWHGSAYDYFRNEVMDANNWFNNHSTPVVPRLPERQNDFGGTLGGPIVIPKLYNGTGKTFFFFSYEGLRLTIPQPSKLLSVPDLTLRQQVTAALKPLLNAFPLPNAGEDGLNDGLGLFNLAYSSPSSLDSTGIRIDHTFGDKFKLFGRYANTPSSGWNHALFANKSTTTVNVQSLTLGATSSLTSTQTNDLHFNITQNTSSSALTSTDLGGGVPLNVGSLPEPNGPSSPLGLSFETYLGFGGRPYNYLQENKNSQRQYNVTDTYAWSLGHHQLKVGVDWRRLTTKINPIKLSQIVEFDSEASLLANNVDEYYVYSDTQFNVEPIYHNFSSFIQDEWKTSSRLSLSLGLRWDIVPPPGNIKGPSPYTADQITNLATTALAPEGTPLWHTDWHAFAPRIGVAYQAHQTPGHQTVLRTGFGLFYDMGNTQGSRGFNYVGFSTETDYFGVPYPLNSTQLTLPNPSVAPPYNQRVFAFDPNLKLPYTMQWNLALEQALGAKQAMTVNYVGAAGRELLATFSYLPSGLGNKNFAASGPLSITSNQSSSDYNALQIKFQRSVSRGLQTLISYTWSHTIDDLTTDLVPANELLRARSDIDIRHNLQAAITYDVPGNHTNELASALLNGWGLDARISARSALPVDVLGPPTADIATHQQQAFHPNLVPGQPIYLYSSQYPGGRIINYNAFKAAPTGVQGNVGRNSAIGFGAAQADLALRRNFAIYDRLHLQFRAEAFNLLNHAMFGTIYNSLGYGPQRFGYAYQTLNTSLGGLNSLYQTGGPRSLQLSLKLTF